MGPCWGLFMVSQAQAALVGPPNRGINSFLKKQNLDLFQIEDLQTINKMLFWNDIKFVFVIKKKE